MEISNLALVSFAHLTYKKTIKSYDQAITVSANNVLYVLF